jgi:hypothetical protein
MVAMLAAPSSSRDRTMLKHLPATIFFVCLILVIVNVSLWNDMAVYLVSIAVGSGAMLIQHFAEKREKDAKAPDRAAQLAHWQAQWQHVDTVLREARKNGGDERLSFLESQLVEAERQLKKLGVPKPARSP